ncbi:MAG: hypothetical protein M1454_01570 [Candidatus Thermoplasmatota archaeon]|nr:hypothetical protein [Candidatus Thermoplasmatota archaeon]MCL5730943.1 hypothetical protein [Candidatus Thermoplasmatota archaeon]
MQTGSGRIDLGFTFPNFPDTGMERISTPAYWYDYNVFLTRSGMLMDALKTVSQQSRIFYSMKANPSRTILKWTIQEGYMTEVSSLGELRHAVASGQRADKLLLLGPGKSERLIKYAMELGIYGIALESLRELNTVLRFHNGITKIFLRINAGSTVPGVKESMTGPDSKFGIAIDQLGDSLGMLRSIDRKLVGIHYYMGSQLLDYRIMVKHHHDVLRRISSYRSKFENIDLGGGFGIPYSTAESELDLQKFASGMRILLQDFGLDDKLIHFETGRYITADCGVFLTRVVDVKDGSGRRILITDGGMNGFMRVAFMKEAHPVRLIFPKLEGGAMRKYSVFGPLCTPLDCFGIDVEMPDRIEEGNIIGIMKAGAYGLSMSPVFFLLQDIPSEYSFINGKIIESAGKIANPEEFFEQMF